MNIYNMKYKELKKLDKEFKKTTLGKVANIVVLIPIILGFIFLIEGFSTVFNLENGNELKGLMYVISFFGFMIVSIVLFCCSFIANLIRLKMLCDYSKLKKIDK